MWADAAVLFKCPTLMQDLSSRRATVLEYWNSVVASDCSSREGLKTATILITREILKERNVRVFNNKLVVLQQWNMGFPLCSQSGTNLWTHQEDIQEMDSSQEMVKGPYGT